MSQDKFSVDLHRQYEARDNNEDFRKIFLAIPCLLQYIGEDENDH
jgi:hypothetical protein